MNKLSITSLRTSLSIERIAVYQNYIATKEPKLLPADVSIRALDLYLWNIKVSSALLELISLYEVTLRNRIFRIIDSEYPNSIRDEFFIRRLPPLTRDKIIKLIDNLIESQENITNPLIVSRLSFPFWGVVLEKLFYYSGSLDENGNKVLPRLYKHNKLLFSINKKLNLEDFNKLVKRLIYTNIIINDLRNRICHHEPIFKSNLRVMYIKILFSLKYLDRNVYKVAKDIERVSDILRNGVI